MVLKYLFDQKCSIEVVKTMDLLTTAIRWLKIIKKLLLSKYIEQGTKLHIATLKVYLMLVKTLRISPYTWEMRDLHRVCVKQEIVSGGWKAE